MRIPWTERPTQHEEAPMTLDLILILLIAALVLALVPNRWL
jgi:hypothetical protein